MVQTSSSNQTHLLVASNNISLSCLEGRIYIITLLHPLPVLIILFNPLPVLVALKILWDITLVHTLIHDIYSLACWVSQKLRPKVKQFRVILWIASSCLVLIKFVDTMT